MTRIGSLFSGCGALDLAVEAVFGGTTVWHSEVDPAASKVLAAHWPDVPNLGDITEIDWTQVESVDVLCGGFPCTDVSAAGKRAGMHGTRSGLWSHMRDAIDALRPQYVIIENVRGLLNANANRPMEPNPDALGNRDTQPVLRAIGAVLGDLADLGTYDARWVTVSAASVGAPHRRERVFVLATDTAGGRQHINQIAGRTPRGQPFCAADERDSQPDAVSGDGPVELLPTPNAQDGNGGGRFGTVRELLPTPRSTDCFGPGLHGDGGMDLRTTISELAKENMYGNETSSRVGSVLGEGEQDRHLLAMDGGEGQQVRAREVYAGPEEPQSPSLGIRESGRPNTGGSHHRSSVPGACMCESGTPGTGNYDGELAAPGCGENSLPTETPPFRGQSLPESQDGTQVVSNMPRVSRACSPGSQTWGKYWPAIDRWEQVTRPAPSPTEPNTKGNPRLSAAFSEWLMGWPDGWVTKVPGISRNDALRIVGNGVCPQQCAAALRWLLNVSEAAA